MTKQISAAAFLSTEAAMSRLLSHGDSEPTYTIARLASEAGLSRATLYGAPELLARFRAAIVSSEAEVKSPPSSTDRVRQLEAEYHVAQPRD
ncbi:hypothetical protein AAFG07_34315 [Bradyrhizobium sp. B097]|uniref:hypothetical protein n=1 Tax=Bradyrhizobium sp. B097 TaxID=3140244 RepID=UPI003184167A